jgi:hypothetical protein
MRQLPAERAMSEQHEKEERPSRWMAGLFFAAILVYTLFMYGGIRSPDSEIVFRTSESLAVRHTFAVPEKLAAWPQFGLPKGRDGRRYSVFGPGEALAAMPLVKLGLWLEQKGIGTHAAWVAPSRYHGKGPGRAMRQNAAANPAPHFLRFVASFLSVFACAGCVIAFFAIGRLLTGSSRAAGYAATLFAFASLLLPYAGDFFSEPLAMLFMLAALHALVSNDVQPGSARRALERLAIAGTALGAAITVHITAILFVPFFGIYALWVLRRAGHSPARLAAAAAAFGAGIALALGVLGYHNLTRFGSVLETGRSADPAMVYATLTNPWISLSGMIFSSGKGLLWYCPLAIFSILWWRPFHRRHRALSWMIITATIFRMVFIACRSDWHGGFCLGPRLLLLAVPLWLLPLAEHIRLLMQPGADRRQARLLFAAAVICMAGQIYFALGEIFDYFLRVNLAGILDGINVFTDNYIYFGWDVSPLFYLLAGRRGPVLLQQAPLSNTALWLILTAAAALLLHLVHRRVLGRTARR